MRDSRDTWIFNIEAASTLSIAAWYVYGIFIAFGKDATNDLHLTLADFYSWGSNWVIPFLLGIFYLGAGYLFQRHQKVNCFSQWRSYMRREFIVLMTPFLAFTLLTLMTGSIVSFVPELKTAGLVGEMPTFSLPSIWDAVLIHPVGPVGYFVVLLGFFVLALFTKTPETPKGTAIFLLVALAVKIAVIVLTDLGISDALPYYLVHMMDNWIWFASGVAICSFKAWRILARPAFAAAMSALFAIGVIVFWLFGITEAAVLSLLTALGLACAYSISAARFLEGPQDRFFGFVTRYTMAIWLMHQMLAQLVLCALFALGFSPVGAFSDVWIFVCGLCCLISCYALPVIVMWVLSHVWKLGFIVYPARYLPEKI